MFKFFSKSKNAAPPTKADFSLLKTDMHSHLLPGIDDGSQDIQTTLDLIKEMMELGFTKFITTPHIMWDMYRNTPAIINEKLELVRQALAEAGINAEIHAAAEYFLDEHVEDLLSRNEKLLTVKDNMVLCEFSMAYEPRNLKDVLFQMQMQGYQPIIAHPERYIYLEGNKDLYEELKASGCYFQLNVLSLSGHYGRSQQELAIYLAKKGYYELIGTDLHGTRHLDGLHTVITNTVFHKLLESGKLLNASL
ncbi:MAG: hypothetical protein IPM85_14260 [Chitinophagaceae bacterium]|nr:hypothetical protein [Chitinophagaceae bacterium]